MFNNKIGEEIITKLKESRGNRLPPSDKGIYYIQFNLEPNLESRKRLYKLLGIKFVNKKMRFILYSIEKDYAFKNLVSTGNSFNVTGVHLLKEELLTPFILLLLEISESAFHDIDSSSFFIEWLGNHTVFYDNQEIDDDNYLL